MFMIMELFLSVILALPLIVQAEEGLIFTKNKRSLSNHHVGLHSLTLDDLHKSDLLSNHLQWHNSLDPIFGGSYSSFFPHSFPANFAEGIFSPGYSLIHNLHQPYAANFAPPVSVPQAVTPQPPPSVPRSPLLPATSYGIPQLPGVPISPPAPPFPNPINRPQVGRLGSGSLGYVHLGNGLYALGSGSLGYTPPPQPAPPAPPVQPPQLNYAAAPSVQPPQLNYAGAVGYTPPPQPAPPVQPPQLNYAGAVGYTAPPQPAPHIQLPQPNYAGAVGYTPPVLSQPIQPLNSNPSYVQPVLSQPIQSPLPAFAANPNLGYRPPVQSQPVQVLPPPNAFSPVSGYVPPVLPVNGPPPYGNYL